MATLDIDADWEDVPEAATSLLHAASGASAVANGVDNPRWMRRYQRGLVLTDYLVALGASTIAFGFRFADRGETPFIYFLLTILLPVVWVATAGLNRAYDATFIGNGAGEYQRVYWTFVHLVTCVALVCYAMKADLARGFILVALPLTLAFVLAARFVSRKYLHHRRKQGRALSDVIVIGAPAPVADLVRAVNRDPTAGLRVVGSCLLDEQWADGDSESVRELAELGAPVLSGLDDIANTVRRHGATTVAVTSPEEIGPQKLRWISWQLEGTSAALVVSPGLIEVAGNRITVRPVSGLPLLHVDAPRFSGPHRLLKGAFDRVVAGLTLLILAPVLLVIAAIVRCTSKGPALFRQTRIGLNGKAFTMLKFRSMRSDAEERLADLVAQNENADGLLFKIRFDPRITSVGRVLRRFSLDELPQLLNVVIGTMSLVGPRPPLPTEVAQYGDDVRRRLLVKPGLTGLWQVSGRSDLSWEDAVRLDLRYVENWSLSLDMLVLWKTLRAVVGSSGAY